MVAPMIAWVEQGIAPDKIIASQINSNDIPDIRSEGQIEIALPLKITAEDPLLPPRLFALIDVATAHFPKFAAHLR